MQVHENLKILRTLKGWSQEQLAAKLNYSLSGYTKIEHGETDIGLKKWVKIAEVLGVNLQKLLGLNESNILNIVENFAVNGNGNASSHYTVVLSETQCTHELEKSRLLLTERDKEVGYLKNENLRLKEIIELLKSSMGK